MIMFLDGGSTDMILMFFSLNMKTFKRFVHSNYVYLSVFQWMTGGLLEHCESSFTLDSISAKYSSNNSNINENENNNKNNNYEKTIFSKLIK